jgi:hypothetical protein
MVTGIFDRITGAGQEDATSRQSSPDDFSAAIADTSAESGMAGVETLEARTDQRLRDTVQELLRLGLLEESHRPNLYRMAVADMAALNAILEPLDLCAQADEVRGLVFLKVLKDESADEQDEWGHPLVRKQRLTLEQTLLIAILRQYFIVYEQEAGTGASGAVVTVDELIPQFQLYLGDSGSEARERTRMLQLLDQLKEHGLVSPPDAHERVVIRPMIAHLANPENLQALLYELKERAAAAGEGEA